MKSTEEKTRAERNGHHLMKHATRKEVREVIKKFINEPQDVQDYINGVKTFEEEDKLPDSKKESKYLENWWIQEMLKERNRKDLEKRAKQK